MPRPGQVWLTETGGIVKFKPQLPDESGARGAGDEVHVLAGQVLQQARRGMRSKVTRLYVYRWFGDEPSARFDAGLVEPDGTPRPGLAPFKKGLKGRQR